MKAAAMLRDAKDRMVTERDNARREMMRSFRRMPWYMTKPVLRYGKDDGGYIDYAEPTVKNLERLLADDTLEFIDLESQGYVWDDFRDRFDGNDAQPTDVFATVCILKSTKE